MRVCGGENWRVVGEESLHQFVCLRFKQGC